MACGPRHSDSTVYSPPSDRAYPRWIGVASLWPGLPRGSGAPRSQKRLRRRARAADAIVA
eukprot:10226738-Lingulodinium_polyedra.AAC.1